MTGLASDPACSVQIAALLTVPAVRLSARHCLRNITDACRSITTHSRYDTQLLAARTLQDALNPHTSEEASSTRKLKHAHVFVLQRQVQCY